VRTLKIKYKTSEENLSLIKEYQRQYSNCLRYMYNRRLEELDETKTKHLAINNINLLDSWFKQSCVKEASQLVNLTKEQNNKPLIFGGKKNFKLRSEKKITEEEFQKKKLSPLYSIGEGSNPSVKGNRKFFIQSSKIIVFKPNRNTKVALELFIGKNQANIVNKLKAIQEEKNCSITYKLDQNYVYISYDIEKVLKENIVYHSVKNRIFSIDLNPNYIGYSIVDWKDSENLDYKLISSGVISIKGINDKDFELKNKGFSSSDKERKYFSNKRRFEILEIGKKLVDLAKHFNCSLFGVEELSIKSKDNQKGSKFNRLVNNLWNRNILRNKIEKDCIINDIKFIEVKPNYSSFLGNIIYRKENKPDMILSSIEVSRRGYEFYHQYILKHKKIIKNIVFMKITDNVKKLIFQSLEELQISFNFQENLLNLYSYVKNSKIKYRVSLDISKVFRQKHNKFQLISID